MAPIVTDEESLNKSQRVAKKLSFSKSTRLFSESLTTDLPAPVSSWRIVMIVDASAISEGMVSELNNIKIMFVGIMSIALVVLLAFVIITSRSHVHNLLLKYIDPVTNSINQQRFAVDAQNLINGGKHKYVLVSLNVRHFKLINEEYGREKADGLLAEIHLYIDKLLDKYVFEHVCADLRSSLEAGREVVPVSVNLSREHFRHENFFSEYEQILEKYGVPHKYIEFEITESLVMEHADDLKKLINRIHEIGFP